MKRTSVAIGQAHPVWKEEVNFKSVQITSDLQVRPLICCISLRGKGAIHMLTIAPTCRVMIQAVLKSNTVNHIAHWLVDLTMHPDTSV